MSPEKRIRKSKMEDISEYSKVSERRAATQQKTITKLPPPLNVRAAQWRNLPISLHRKVRKHFEYVYTQKSVFNELGVLRQLPVAMRVQLTLEIHSHKVEKLQMLLKGMNLNFVAEVILLLRPFFLNIGGTMGVHNVVPDQVSELIVCCLTTKLNQTKIKLGRSSS